MKRSAGERVFGVINLTVLSVFGLSTLMPFVHIIAKSFSAEHAVLSNSVGFWPVGFQTDTYSFAMNQPLFYNSFFISVVTTLVGTLLSLALTVVAAYPLSRPHFRGKRIFVSIIVFTMLFNGGLIPNFMVVKTLGLLNNPAVIVLTQLFSVYNMLVIKSFFEQLPESVEEAARIDGATHLTVLLRVIVPMSTPVLATVSLFYAVAYWNNFFTPLMYITMPEYKPMQLYIYELIQQSRNALDSMDYTNLHITADSIRAASVVIAMVPILIVYPFLQKYFVKGMTLGAVKE